MMHALNSRVRCFAAYENCALQPSLVSTNRAEPLTRSDTHTMPSERENSFEVEQHHESSGRP